MERFRRKYILLRFWLACFGLSFTFWLAESYASSQRTSVVIPLQASKQLLPYARRRLAEKMRDSLAWLS